MTLQTLISLELCLPIQLFMEIRKNVLFLGFIIFKEFESLRKIKKSYCLSWNTTFSSKKIRMKNKGLLA